MLFRNIRAKEALAIARRCSLVSGRAVYLLLAYYLLAVLNALVDGVSLILLVDLVTGNLDLGGDTLVIGWIGRALERFSVAPDFSVMYFVLIGLIFFKFFLVLAYRSLDGYLEAVLRRRVQEEGFASVLRGDWERLRDMRVGERVGAVTEEASNTAKYIASAVRALYSLLAVVVLSAIALAVSIEVSLLFMAIGVPVLLVLRYLFNLQARIAEKLVKERQGFYASVTERLNGLFQIKVEGNSEHHIAEGLRNQDLLTHHELRWWYLRAFINAFNVLLPVTVLLLSYAWASYKGVHVREIMGIMAGVVIVGARALGMLNQLSANIGNITGYAGSIPPVYSLFTVPEETRRQPVPEKISRVELAGVTYMYNPEAGVSDITMSAETGRPLVMMGESGSGKTTLANLMAGLYMPSSGKISYVGVSGRSYDSSSYRPRVGYVTQDIHLFHGTVRENLLASYDLRGDDGALWNALEMAGAKDFITRMGGLDAVITEAGRSLSGGQRRRIGIARILVGAPDILILDEVTAGLDEERKTGLVRTIKELAGSLVVVIITHDPLGMDRELGEVLVLGGRH